MSIANGRAKVSISAKGTIIFNSAAVTAFNLREVELVWLFYSVSGEFLAIKAADNSGCGTPVIRAGTGLRITESADFLRTLNLISNRTRTCDARWDYTGETIVMRVSQVQRAAIGR
ncbi:MAG: hypothetical protein JWO13_399 [Acidobacteriales bacterium]|nr:hypothetical protein [Terriglobales bacterium]